MCLILSISIVIMNVEQRLMELFGICNHRARNESKIICMAHKESINTLDKLPLSTIIGIDTIGSYPSDYTTRKIIINGNKRYSYRICMMNLCGDCMPNPKIPVSPWIPSTITPD